MSQALPIIAIDTRWERSALRLRRDETALRITLRGQRPAAPDTRRAGIDVAFALDRSGSMAGDKIALVKQAIVAAFDRLGPVDRASLVIFDNEVEVIQPLEAVTPALRTLLRQRLETFGPRGATALSDGWLTACWQLSGAGIAAGERLQRAIVLTDGLANAGITDSGELAHHAGELWARGISTTTMGVGHDYDEVLLSGMAEAGGGNFEHIAHPGQFEAFFASEIGGLTRLAALHPRLEITLPRGLRAWLLNQYPSQRVEKTITVDLRDLPDGEEIDLIFRVTHRGNLDATSSRVAAHVTAVDPGTHERVRLPVEIEPLAFVSEGEAERAPVDHVVALARAREEAITEQREALRLDREGRHQESRMRFARSSAVLSEADAMAARAGYAGLDAATLHEYQADLHDAALLASAPAAALDEETRKSRTARHAHRSRGGTSSTG